uniref:Uncharacterized protein n=1 Tax=Nicotiana tabacum TaxID=4097 RepID=A0A1S4BS93_TOBAC|nr:PREDICTED: uncharacterized protein LOC107811360 [Nicotiana tabacum]
MQPGQATQKSDFQTIQRSNGRDWASANRQNTPKKITPVNKPTVALTIEKTLRVQAGEEKSGQLIGVTGVFDCQDDTATALKSDADRHVNSHQIDNVQQVDGASGIQIGNERGISHDQPAAAHADLIEKSLGPITQVLDQSKTRDWAVINRTQSSPSKSNVSIHKTQTSAAKTVTVSNSFEALMNEQHLEDVEQTSSTGLGKQQKNSTDRGARPDSITTENHIAPKLQFYGPELDKMVKEWQTAVIRHNNPLNTQEHVILERKEEKAGQVLVNSGRTSVKAKEQAGQSQVLPGFMHNPTKELSLQDDNGMERVGLNTSQHDIPSNDLFDRSGNMLQVSDNQQTLSMMSSATKKGGADHNGEAHEDTMSEDEEQNTQEICSLTRRGDNAQEGAVTVFEQVASTPPRMQIKTKLSPNAAVFVPTGQQLSGTISNLKLIHKTGQVASTSGAAA